MRPIAAVTAVVLLGFFTSSAASQTTSPLPSYDNPYQPMANVSSVAPNAPRHLGTAYQSAPLYRAPPPIEPAPANIVIPASHETPVAATDQGQTQPIHQPFSNSTAPAIAAPNQNTQNQNSPHQSTPLTKNSLVPARKNRTDDMKLGASRKGENQKQSYDGRGGLPSLPTIVGSLGLVIGLFLIAAFLMRRVTPMANTALPNEVVEILGRAPLANRQQVHLLRCGNKLLLVCVTPNGTETLTEITDPVEVDRLAAICRQNSDGSATANFRQVIEQLSWKDAPSEKKGGRA